jgi:hypothetical protein
MNDTPWIVWGDSSDPMTSGTEEEVKAYVKDSPVRASLYLQAPDGREFEEDRSKGGWREIL